MDDPRQPGLVEPQAFQELGLLPGVAQEGELCLDRRRDHHEAGAVLGRPRGQSLGMGIAFGRGSLVDVGYVEHRLGGQEVERTELPALVLGHGDVAGRPAGGERLVDGLQHGQACLGLLVAAARALGRGLALPLDAFQVGDQQLGLHGLGVADRVDARLDMGHVAFEAAQNMGDGVDLADVREELVAEPLAFGGAAHQAGDIDELQKRGRRLWRFGGRGDARQPPVGHRHPAHVGLDGAEREISRRRGRGFGHRVEQGGLAHVGQADDAAGEAHVSRSSRRLRGLRRTVPLLQPLAAASASVAASVAPSERRSAT